MSFIGMRVLIKKHQLLEYEASNSYLRFLFLLPSWVPLEGLFAHMLVKRVNKKYKRYVEYKYYAETRKIHRT